VPSYDLTSSSLLRYLGDGFSWTESFVDLNLKLIRRYPRPVLEVLRAGGFVRMRGAEGTKVTIYFDSDQIEENARRLRVLSGVWTGAEVEREFTRAYERAASLESVLSGRSDVDKENGAEQDLESPVPAVGSIQRIPGGSLTVSVAVHIDFRLVVTPTEEDRQRDDRSPFVEVTVYEPVPEPGTIAREYDRVVREQQQWHLALPGASGNQEKEVALRTWAVGLRMADGARFGQAMREVSSALGTVEVSQSRFNEDRARLLERVPEARLYLYARGTAAPSLAKD
jgi:hypothetical protein